MPKSKDKKSEKKPNKKTAAKAKAPAKGKSAPKAKSKAKPKKPAKKAGDPVITISQDAVAKRAYELWIAEGRPDGRAHAHWKAAESELIGAK